MSGDMLGKIALDEVSGLIKDWLEKLNSPDGRKWLSASKRFLRKEDPWPKVYRVEVNYDLKLEAAIRAGHYDYNDNLITEANFPSTRQGTAYIDIMLVHYGREIVGSRSILKDLSSHGLRAAELPELLALAARHANLQLQFPIAALGSLWLCAPAETADTPCLNRSSNNGRRLGMVWSDGYWNGDYRFAAVRTEFAPLT